MIGFCVTRPHDWRPAGWVESSDDFGRRTFAVSDVFCTRCLLRVNAAAEIRYQPSAPADSPPATAEEELG